MAYGRGTANKMDAPLKKLSVVTQYLGDNGYSFSNRNEIYVLSFANGSTATYDESSATAPFGTPGLAVPTEQTLTLAYNKSMITRIQRTQQQDVPIDNLAAKWAAQQISEVFIPEHDEYSLNKIWAARPVANTITVTAAQLTPAGTEKASYAFERAINKARVSGNKNTSMMVAWLSYTFASVLAAQINFTGSDEGYADAKSGYLGRHKGVVCVETPDDYFTTGTYALIADKRAIVNVKPKINPEDYRILREVPAFDGVEVQLRDRSDTFVLSKRVGNIASIEDVASTTTTTTA